MADPSRPVINRVTGSKRGENTSKKNSNRSQTGGSVKNEVEELDSVDRGYMVLYKHVSGEDEFVRAMPGDIVFMVGTASASKYNWEEEVPKVEKAPSAKEIPQAVGHTGLMAPYFMLKVDHMSDKDLKKKYPEVFATWYLGAVSPIVAVAKLRSSWFEKFSFVVCAPPEYDRDREYSELLLIVRMYSGPEYTLSEHAEMLAKHKNRKPRSDRLPGENSPMPVYAALRIRRSATGGYGIQDDNTDFNSVLELIENYTTMPFLIDMEQQPELKMNDPARITVSHPLKPADMPPPPVYPGEVPESLLLSFKGVVDNPLFACAPDDIVVMNEKGKSREAKGTFGVKYSCDATLKTNRGQKSQQHQVTVVVLRDNLRPDSISKAFEEIRDIKKVLHPRRNYSGTDYLGKYFLYNARPGTPGPKSLIVSAFYGKSLIVALQARFKDKNKLTTRSLVEVLYQVVAGMRSLADMELYHGTLSPANVMLVEEWPNAMRVKVVDYFVYSRIVDTRDNRAKLEAQLYRRWSPQMLQSKRELGSVSAMVEADVWSFGVLMYEVLTHCEFEAFQQFTSPADLLKHLESDVPRLPSFDYENFRVLLPADMYETAASCLRWRPTERITFDLLFAFLNDVLHDAEGGPCKAILAHRDDTPSESGPEDAKPQSDNITLTTKSGNKEED